ncbi:MAG: 1-acyl-sn-glycerol-3-phosphate acyltransferase [Bacteroidales bacterium]|nr:1-acyl-sn-glycerol-3-phosphate acyltransferase [Bacteroidales bacterium]
MSTYRKTHYGKRWSRFCGWLLRRLGWTAVGGPPPEPRVVMLGVPHTSMADFLVAYLFYTSFGEVAHTMVKKELFFWPLGGILRACGCIPVDRSNPGSLVKSLISEMEQDEFFKLAVAPEGTRKPVRRWKAGGLAIAREAGVPVYAGWFDWRTKRISCGEKFELTDDLKADMARLQDHYEKLHLTGKHPDNYLTH